MKLNFDEIVSIAGKGGLYKILKPTKNGYIVEELKESRKKLVLGSNHRVSLLKEISIYTTDTEGAVALREVYAEIQKKYKIELPVDAKEDSDALFSFLKEVVPNFDSEKVYQSDVKKLVSWYGIITQEDPEISFVEEEVKEEAQAEQKDALDIQKTAKPKTKTRKAAPVKKANAPAKMVTKKPVTPQKKG